MPREYFQRYTIIILVRNSLLFFNLYIIFYLVYKFVFKISLPHDIFMSSCTLCSDWVYTFFKSSTNIGYFSFS